MAAIDNLVKQQSTSTGTGNFTLTTALGGFQTFDQAFSTTTDLDIFHYYIIHQTLTEWEYGTGHMSGTNTLVRDTVIQSSNSNAAVNFSAGNKAIVNDLGAQKQRYLTNVTSDIQTQLGTKVTTIAVTTANGISGISSGGTTPALTLTLGAITPTSVNSVVLSGSSTPTLAVTGTATISGTNTGDQNLSGYALLSGTLGQFAATTSAQLAGVISDETGSGGGGLLVFNNAPTLIAPVLGVATATSLNGVVLSGSSTPSLAVSGSSSISGSNTGDQTSVTGNAGTATALQNARLIGGVSFDGTADITPTNIQPASESSDTTCFPLFVNAASGTAQQPKYRSTFGYNSSTNALTATTFIGALTGNASTATLAATATALATPRNINGVSFDGSADITVTAAAGTLTGTTLNSTVVTSSLTSLGIQAQILDMGSHRISNVTDPSGAQDAATKNYVDTVAQGLSAKASAIVATAAALPTNTYSNGVSGVGATLTGVATGVLTVDGVATALGNRIVVKNEVAPANNGLYLVTTAGALGVAYVLTRTTDADTSAELDGAFVFVESGTANTATGWTIANATAITIGTTGIVWTQFSGAGTYTASTGLTLTGTAFSITATGVSGSSVGSSTSIPTLNYNAQGQLTSVSGNAVVAPAGTLTGTTLAANVVTSSLTSVGTLINLTVTNTITGSISGNAATVTTNANLTGVITSSGNATSIASQTGTGTKFVVDNAPTLISPSTNTLTFSATAAPAYAAGKLVYDSDNESLTFFNNDSAVGLQVGQEEWIRVKNVSGSTIANGKAVYITGASAGLPTIALAKGDASATIICCGLTTESIANNAIGYVTCIGVVHGLDTSAFSAGATVFVSEVTAGSLTSTAPTAPNYRYRVGIVAVSDATVGTIHVTPSTAALGNGTANQVFGINNAGTAQEVKSIVGTASRVTVTHTANTITLTLPATINVDTSGNAATVTTNANLTGEATSTGNAVTLTNSAVIGKALTGFSSGAGTVASTDTILQAVNKLDGNDKFKLLATGTASSSSSLDFTTFDNTTYGNYVFVFDRLVNGGAEIWLRFSTDGGSTYQAANSAYSWSQRATSQNMATPADTLTGDSSTTTRQQIRLSNISGGTTSGVLNMYGAAATTNSLDCAIDFTFTNGGGGQSAWITRGGKLTTGFVAGAVTAVRFLPNTSTFTSGVIKMYGVKK